MRCLPAMVQSRSWTVLVGEHVLVRCCCESVPAGLGAEGKASSVPLEMDGAGRGVESHPTHWVDRSLNLVGRLDLEELDGDADSLARADAGRNHVDALL